MPNHEKPTSVNLAPSPTRGEGEWRWLTKVLLPAQRLGEGFRVRAEMV